MTTEKKDKKLIKQDDRKTKIGRVLKLFTESVDFSDDKMVEEYADLKEKKDLTPGEEKKKRELQLEIMMITGLSNGLWLANISYKKYYKSLITMRSSLVKEYNCKTPIEFMLVDRIMASYWRAMRCDTIFNKLMEREDGRFSCDQLKVNIFKEFNKTMELANRQLNTNIILLKELKQPKLNVKVNTENAFIGQNQQFNVNKQKNNQQQSEIIEPK